MNVMQLDPEQEEQKKELLETLEREISDSPFMKNMDIKKNYQKERRNPPIHHMK